MKGKAKIFKVFLSIGLIIVMLMGCGQPTKETQASPSTTPQSSEKSSATPAPVNSEKPKEKVKITFWHTYGDAEEPFFNESVLPLFKEQFPDIEVEALRQEGGQFNQLIITAMGTQQTPDVARVDITNVASYANQGGLLSLDDMENFSAMKDQLLPGPLATNLFRGKYYGLPLDTNCKSLVANMDVMGKLGLSQVPKTFEEFIDASKKNSPGKYTLTVSGTGDWDTYVYFWLFGGVLTDDQFTRATGYMDSPESIAALQKILDLHNEKVLTVRDVDGTPDAWDGIKTGEFAAFFEGPWYFSANADYKDNGIAPALIPAFNGKSASVVGGEDIVIFNSSKHPKEAYEFVKFMLSEKVQMLMATKGQMPVLKSAVNNDQIKNDPVLSVYQKQLESAFTRIPSPQNSAIGQIWSEEIMKALMGEVTAEEALKSAAAKIDAELAK